MLTGHYRNTPPPPPLFVLEDLEKAFRWICDLRKRYSANSDIWRLRSDWEAIKNCLLSELNAGTYQFSPLERYDFDDAIVSLWLSRDMIALKLISSALATAMSLAVIREILTSETFPSIKLMSPPQQIRILRIF